MSDLVEATTLDAFKWWSLADLFVAEERLTPLSLAQILDRYVTSGPPTELPEEEVLVD